MDLFESAENSASQPLAYRMRPRTIDEFVGQEHIAGPGRLLRRVIQADRLSSIIFYGPPGTGKTTLARVIANTTKSHFITMNAVLSGVKDLRRAIEEADSHKNLYDRRTILFVDEVHRWNKAQQDALLPSVENGTVILIGATTQNPYFEVNSALVSRSRIFQLKPLTDDDLRRIARGALEDPVRGYGDYAVHIAPDAMEHLVNVANGDARSLLNALELAVETTPEHFPPPHGTEIRVDLQTAEESIQRKAVLYDKEGDYHYDTISAFIKSIRGSDPDAALYWMARMIHAGEDPHYVFRRMLILAGEDVGMADPSALTVVTAAAAAFDRVGMPEGQFHLAHAALYLATAPKSNSTLGFFDAVGAVEEEHAADVPNHLRDANRDKQGFGHGEGYKYPHAYADHWVAQQYLPADLRGRIFYRPSDQGHEAGIRESVLRRREAQLAVHADDPADEVLTFSPPDKQREHWIDRTLSGRTENLEDVRSRVFSFLSPERHDRILDLAARTGLLLWEAFRRVPEGSAWGIVGTDRDMATLEHHAQYFDETDRPILERGSLAEVLKRLEDRKNLRFEAVVGHNPFTRVADRHGCILRAASLLSEGGRFVIAQVIPSRSQRLSQFVRPETSPNGLSEELLNRIRDAEEELYSGDLAASEASPLLGWAEDSLVADMEKAGIRTHVAETQTYVEQRRVAAADIDSWLAVDRNTAGGSSYGSALTVRLSDDEIRCYRDNIKAGIGDKVVQWRTHIAFVAGRKP